MSVVLGQKYRDRLTGIEGIATGRYEYLYGCVRIGLEVVKDGEVKDVTFDEQRLTDQSSATSGGPREAPAQRPTP